MEATARLAVLAHSGAARHSSIPDWRRGGVARARLSAVARNRCGARTSANTRSRCASTNSAASPSNGWLNCWLLTGSPSSRCNGLGNWSSRDTAGFLWLAQDLVESAQGAHLDLADCHDALFKDIRGFRV